MELRRTIDELRTLYQMEPEIRDLYVEGFVDENFFKWYLRRQGLETIGIYPVEFIDVPNEILLRHSLPIGSNKSRLIALSHELAVCPFFSRVMCIVDRDFDGTTGDRYANPCLYKTDGNSLELYALQPSVFHKFVLVGLGGFPIPPQELLSQCTATLEKIYAIRAANERLGWSMSWVPFRRYISISGSSITFRQEAFIRAYLQKNDRWNAREEFSAAVREMLESLDDEPMRRIRGHDLSELLFVIIKKIQKEKQFGNPGTLESCMLATADVADLDQHPLFRMIRQFAKEADSGVSGEP